MQNARFFKKLEDKAEHNLMNIFGKGKHYVWIRAEFEIPPQFKNQPLGMVIPQSRCGATALLFLNTVCFRRTSSPRNSKRTFSVSP